MHYLRRDATNLAMDESSEQNNPSSSVIIPSYSWSLNSLCLVFIVLGSNGNYEITSENRENLINFAGRPVGESTRDYNKLQVEWLLFQRGDVIAIIRHR